MVATPQNFEICEFQFVSTSTILYWYKKQKYLLKWVFYMQVKSDK